MGTQTLTGSVTLIPSGNTGASNVTADSTYSADRGYTNADSTTYARWTLSSNSNVYVYYTFDTSDIPANATITSISARGKARVNNNSRVTNTSMQLCSGTSAKGTSTAFAMTTASTQNLSPGTVSAWTRADLNDLRLKISCTGSGSSTRRFDFYGADVTIGYSYTVTTYDVTVSNSTSATVTASNSSPVSGEDVDITTNTISGITIKDNNVDVTSQFTQVTGGTITTIPTSATVTNFTVTDPNNALTGADSTNYARYDAAGGTTGTVYLDLSTFIPSSATIQSVSCQATLEYNRNNSSSGASGSCQLYSGTTAKGSSQTIISSGGTSVAKTTYTLSVGSWTASELANARFYMTMTNSASSTHRYMYIYGVTLTVTYTISGTLYVYTISNVGADHTITVTSSGGSTTTMYVKVNGSWVAATAVYKKVNGSWVEQTDLTNVFDNGTNYKIGS